MTTLLRAVAFAAVVLTAHATETWWLARIQPGVASARAVRQLNGNDSNAQALRWLETEKNTIDVAGFAIIAIAAVLLFQRPIQRVLATRSRRWPLSSLAITALCFTGCMRPYDKPEFATIDTAETGFLIPLESDGKNQDKFASEEYLTQLKVAAKRVQIPHRWQQTGPLDSSGNGCPRCG